jgi:hypothetical protein
VERLLTSALEEEFSRISCPLSGIVTAAENLTAAGGLSPQITGRLEKLRDSLRSRELQREIRMLLERIEELLGAGPQIRIRPGEAWSDKVLADLSSLPGPAQSSWIKLFAHAQSGTGAKPSARWLKEGKTLVDAVGEKDFTQRLLGWLPLVDRPRTRERDPAHSWALHPLTILDQKADTLRGLVWCSSFSEDRQLARALVALTVSAYKKIPGQGPRAVKIGNACIHVLGAMPGRGRFGQLAVLKARVKAHMAQKSIEKAMTAAAERAGIPREEFDEIEVPAYGLTEVGRRKESLGELTAELTVTGRSTRLEWIHPKGKRSRSVPAAVKRDFPRELKELKEADRDIQKMLPAQSDRIERLVLAKRSWPLPVWRERYLDHPLVGTLARRLIWRFRPSGAPVGSGLPGVWHEGTFVNSAGSTLDMPAGETIVELWHPIRCSTDEIVAWRSWLEEHEVRQPFKQAHREVYVLTDAERRTGTYSNRFAAHILRQHQFNALCVARGWKNQLRLQVDAEYPPTTLDLPLWSLRAEFWVEGAGSDYGADTNHAGVFLHVATDQVRFYPLRAPQVSTHASGGGYRLPREDGGGRPVALEDIPPLVLSASTRKDVLQRLVPRLKIASRSSFSDRFLVVRGDIRTYKIQLGSGNILMEPDDEYLCIVPDPGVESEASNVFLPFEGDGRLSVILSKAFLLAEDTKIEDETILRQIRRL